jgi:hypothetical protein
MPALRHAVPPYYECEDRRRYKRLHHVLRALVKAGVMARRPDGRYHTTAPYPPDLRSHRIKPDDSRYLPRPYGKLLRFLFADVNGPMDLERLAWLAGGGEAVDREIAGLVNAHRVPPTGPRSDK